jgi:DNA-binding transcriptional LysR family regulator
MDLRRVDLNLLVAFDALMDERSVTRAATRLYVGQSAMSATLARIRELFDDPVLIRQGRQLVPTPVAEALAGPVKDILDRTGAMLGARGSFDPASDKRSFNIIASDYLTYVFLRPLLEPLAREAPGVKLFIRPINDTSVEEFRHNKVDLLITAREAFAEHAEFPHEVLFSDRFVCAVCAGHPEVGEAISLEQFQSLPYLATSAGKLPGIAEMELDRLGIARNTEITTGFTLGFLLLPGTRLVCMVLERYAEEFRERLGIRTLEPPVDVGGVTEVLVWTQRNSDDPGHRWLRERLQRLAKERMG